MADAAAGRAVRSPLNPLRWPALLLVGAVRVYQLVVSPWLGPTCRFYPSCSAYAVEALEVHGAGRGSWLAARRLAKCAPWHPGGVDLVPSEAPHRAPRPAPGRTPPQEAGVV